MLTRAAIAVVLVVSAVLLGLGSSAAGSGASDWPQFRYDSAHGGLQPNESAIGVGNVANLTEAWTATTGGAVRSSPAVANGVVFVGSDDHKLHAFDAATGVSKWTSADTGNIISSSPAVADVGGTGTVFVGSEGGASARLYAYRADGQNVGVVTGCPSACTPLWTANLHDSIYGSPAVAYVAGRWIVYIGQHELFAFDAATGALLWESVDVGTGTSVSPAVAEVAGTWMVYFGADEGGPWVFDANGNAPGCPNFCGDLWGGGQSGSIRSSPAVANGIYYVATYFTGILYAFDAAGVTNCISPHYGCGPLWSSGSNISGGIYSSPAVAYGRVYVGSFAGKLYVFNAAGCGNGNTTCNSLWTATTGGGIDSSPAVANGVVYVGSGDDKLYAFNAAGCGNGNTTCNSLWTATTGGDVESSPAVANGFVYVGSTDGKLYAYLLPDTTPPTIAITYPTGSGTPQHPATLHGLQQSILFSVTDAVSGIDTWTLRQYRTMPTSMGCTTGWVVKRTVTDSTDGALSDPESLTAGMCYYWTLEATDNAGNTAATVTSEVIRAAP